MLYQLLKQEDVINHRKQSYINTQDNNYNRHIKDYFSKVKDVSKLDYDDIYKYTKKQDKSSFFLISRNISNFK